MNEPKSSEQQFDKKPEKRQGEDFGDGAVKRTHSPSSPNDGKPFRKEETGATESGNEDQGAKQ